MRGFCMVIMMMMVLLKNVSWAMTFEMISTKHNFHIKFLKEHKTTLHDNKMTANQWCLHNTEFKREAEVFASICIFFNNNNKFQMNNNQMKHVYRQKSLWTKKKNAEYIYNYSSTEFIISAWFPLLNKIHFISSYRKRINLKTSPTWELEIEAM